MFGPPPWLTPSLLWLLLWLCRCSCLLPTCWMAPSVRRRLRPPCSVPHLVPLPSTDALAVGPAHRRHYGGTAGCAHHVCAADGGQHGRGARRCACTPTLKAWDMQGRTPKQGLGLAGECKRHGGRPRTHRLAGAVVAQLADAHLQACAPQGLPPPPLNAPTSSSRAPMCRLFLRFDLCSPAAASACVCLQTNCPFWWPATRRLESP